MSATNDLLCISSCSCLDSYRYSLAYRRPGALSAVGGHAGVVKSEITMSLALLKETSVLGSKVPCISPIAGLLLYLIQVYDVRILSLIIKSTFYRSRK